MGTGHHWPRSLGPRDPRREYGGSSEIDEGMATRVRQRDRVAIGVRGREGVARFFFFFNLILFVMYFVIIYELLKHVEKEMI